MSSRSTPSEKQTAKSIPEPQRGKAEITREEVIDRLWELASLPASGTKNNIGGQVRAVSMPAEVLGMKLARGAGLTREFEGRSSEEQEFFAVHGYWPESVEPAQSRAVAVKSDCAKTGQPN